MRFNEFGKGGSPKPFAAVLSPAQITRIIQILQASGHGYQAPLYRAALAGEVIVGVTAAGGRLPNEFFWHGGKPKVAIIAGDDVDPSKPRRLPSEFPQTQKMLEWAASVCIHATGGAEMHYAGFVMAAQICGRVLVIETGTAAEDDWTAVVTAERKRREPGNPLLGAVISARPRGGFHPAPPAAAEAAE